LNVRILRLIATVIEVCDPPREGTRGQPPAETIRVLATLRRFLREGTPWRSLTATAAQASGSTLRRWLTGWARMGLLAQVHAVLVGMLRGHPDLILDGCSVRAKRAGDLTGPNPTDRAKRGTKDNVAVDGDGVPVACVATAANVNDTLVFERLFLAAYAVMARIRTVFADKGYDAEHHRELCRVFGARPRIYKRGASRPAPGWASVAGRSSAATHGCWRTSVSPCAMTGLASSFRRCCKLLASSWLQDASLANSENRL
jgi:transposase